MGDPAIGGVVWSVVGGWATTSPVRSIHQLQISFNSTEIDDGYLTAGPATLLQKSKPMHGTTRDGTAGR